MDEVDLTRNGASTLNQISEERTLHYSQPQNGWKNQRDCMSITVMLSSLQHNYNYVLSFFQSQDDSI